MRLIDILDAQYEIVEFFEGWVDYMSGLGSTPREEYRKPQAFYRQTIIMITSSSLFLTKFERSYNRQLGGRTSRTSKVFGI